MNKLTPIKFIRSWHQYNSGEIAGFTKALAGDIVNSGFGEFLTSPRPHLTKPAEEAGDVDDDAKVEAVDEAPSEEAEPGEATDAPDDGGDGMPDAPEGLDPDGHPHDGIHAEHRGGGRYYLYRAEERADDTAYTKTEIEAWGYE